MVYMEFGHSKSISEHYNTTRKPLGTIRIPSETIRIPPRLEKNTCYAKYVWRSSMIVLRTSGCIWHNMPCAKLGASGLRNSWRGRADNKFGSIYCVPSSAQSAAPSSVHQRGGASGVVDGNFPYWDTTRNH